MAYYYTLDFTCHQFAVSDRNRDGISKIKNLSGNTAGKRNPVLPVILLLIGQMTGVIILSNFIMLASGALVLILDYILIKRISATFIPEKLI